MADNNKKPPAPWMKNLGLWFVILLGLVVVVNLMQGSSKSSATGTTMAYSDFLTKVDEGGIRSVEIRGAELVGKTSGDEDFRTYNPGDTQLVQRLRF